MANTPNFSIPLYTGTDTAKLSTLLNGQATAIDTNLKTYLDGQFLNKARQYVGTTAGRTSVTGMTEGDTYQENDSLKLKWVYQGAKWLIAPGQLLASMSFYGANTTGSGSVVNTVISTPTLPIGQKIKIVGSCSTYNVSSAGNIVTTLAWRNNATNVTLAVNDGIQTKRQYGTAASNVCGASAFTVAYTTTVAAKVSAGIFNGDAVSGVYNADGSHLWIESA